MSKVNQREIVMSADDFKVAIHEMVEGLKNMHIRLMRIEKWMVRQEEDKKQKQFRSTSTKLK